MADTGLEDVTDLLLYTGLLGPTRLIMVARCLDEKGLTGPLDRDVPFQEDTIDKM